MEIELLTWIVVAGMALAGMAYMFLCAIWFRHERDRYQLLFEDRNKRYWNFIQKFGHEHDLKEKK